MSSLLMQSAIQEHLAGPLHLDSFFGLIRAFGLQGSFEF